MSADLIPHGGLDPVKLFTGGGIDAVLLEIERRALDFNPSVSTAKDRKQIASMAYKVSQSKVLIDDIGKTLVADLKRQIAVIDPVRKHARDFLDDLRDRVRKPLNDWEAEEAAKAEALRLAEEMAKAEEDAYADHEIWLKQKKLEEQVRRAQEELAEERRRAEEAEALAAEKKRQADLAAAKEQEALARAALEAERLAAKEKAAELAAKEAEKQAALEEKRKAEETLARKLAEEERARAAEKAAAEEEQHRIQNREHRRAINQAVVAGLVMNVEGLTQGMAIDIVKAVVSGRIKNIRIEY